MSTPVSKWGLVALVATIALLSSCVTAGNRDYRAGERDFEARNYVGAVDNAVKALETNPEHEEAAALLRRALPRATEQLEEQIAQLQSSSEQFAGERIIELYEELARVHGDVAALSMGLDTTDYGAQLQAAREAAAQARYDAGTSALAAGGFQNARQALAHFRRAAELVSNYRDTAALIAQAENASRARLYVYVNGADAAVAQQIGDQLMNNQNLAQVTELVQANAIVPGAGRDAAAVLSQVASRGVDLLLYVELGNVTVEQQALSQTDKVLVGGSEGFEVSAAYNVVQPGRWQVYDVAAGSVRNEDSFRIGTSQSLTFDLLPPSGSGELSFSDVPPRTIAYADMPSVNIISLTRTLTKTSNFMDGHSAADFTNAEFNDMSERLKDVVLHPDVYGFNIEGGSLMASHGQSPAHSAQLEEYLTRMRAILEAILSNAGNIDAHVQRAVQTLPAKAVATVARAAVAPLSQ